MCVSNDLVAEWLKKNKPTMISDAGMVITPLLDKQIKIKKVKGIIQEYL